MVQNLAVTMAATKDYISVLNLVLMRVELMVVNKVVK